MGFAGERPLRGRENGAIKYWAGAGLAWLAVGATPVGAFPINVGNPDVTVNWNSTVKYSTAYRLHDASSALLYSPNNPLSADLDDGDENFRKSGFVSNRVDLFSELDVKYRDFGFRVSGAAWYDSFYNRPNQNNSPGTVNSTSVAYNQFTDATRTTQGRNAEVLDAFGFGKIRVGQMPLTFRVGQFAQLWGETLFFGTNGIAGGMAPTDVDKLVSVPSTEFKEIVLPVPQASGQLQILPNLSVGAYYQFGWRSDQLPPAGSYFSSADIVGQGSEGLYLLPIPGLPRFVKRAPDQAASNTGQYGADVRFSPANTGLDLGFYAIRYHAKDPQTYVLPASATYELVYPEAITSYGASVSATFGRANVAAEVSIRRNMPLVSDIEFDPTGRGNNNSNPLYAVGNSAHANVSVLYSLPRTPLWQDASLAAEVGWNRRTSITKNPSALDPNVTRDAVAVRAVFTPTYYQALPGLDLSVPIGIGYNPVGASSVVGGFNGGVRHGGDLSIGAKGNYDQVWTFTLTYTRFLGPIGRGLTPQGFTFDQTLGDRDYVALSVSRAF